MIYPSRGLTDLLLVDENRINSLDEVYDSDWSRLLLLIWKIEIVERFCKSCTKSSTFITAFAKFFISTHICCIPFGADQEFSRYEDMHHSDIKYTRRFTHCSEPRRPWTWACLCRSTKTRTISSFLIFTVVSTLIYLFVAHVLQLPRGVVGELLWHDLSFTGIHRNRSSSRRKSNFVSGL